MRDILIDLNTSARSKSYITDNYNIQPSMLEYILNTLKENKFISSSIHDDYSIKPEGMKFVVERLLDTK